MEIQQYIKDYTTLTKPKVNLLLVITALSAIFLASDNFPSFQVLIAVVVGGTFASGGAGAINHSIDKDIDNTMKRTSARPVAGERISKLNALIFGVILNVASFIILTLLTNVLAAFMAISGTLFYVLIYSIWLKKKTFHNIVIGGAAGCFPPLVGWSAVTGDLSLSAWYLFAIIFFWTPPHFWALALYRSGDYQIAKIPMLPLTNGRTSTINHIMVYSLILSFVSFMPAIFGYSGLVYLLIIIPLDIAFVWFAYCIFRNDTDKNAKVLFGFSILYLFLVFSGLLADDHLLSSFSPNLL